MWYPAHREPAWGLNVHAFLLMGYPGRLELDETNTESASRVWTNDDDRRLCMPDRPSHALSLCLGIQASLSRPPGFTTLALVGILVAGQWAHLERPCCLSKSFSPPLWDCGWISATGLEPLPLPKPAPPWTPWLVHRRPQG